MSCFVYPKQPNIHDSWPKGNGNGDRRKRTEEDDVRFAQSFEKLILMAKSKEGDQSGTI